MTTAGDRLVGTVLDRRYRIESPIARGGMSTVYRATDLRLDRPVAVKVMDPQFAADPQFLARFEFEARSVARLAHPGLVAVYDQGQDGDHVFLVMELVEGGTLRELLRERGPMPPHAAVAVAAPVLGALAVAHRAGLVHRDVKPENVLISDRGEVKIADFGLVRAVAAATTTSRSVILGTAAYLSPEQVTVGSADARSDVYSAGVLMFEMLTGRAPFTGDTSLSVAYQRVDNDVPDPGSLIDGVPEELDEFVRQATEREPGERFPDAGIMAASLADLADELDLPRYRVPAPRRSAQHLADATAVDPDGRTAHAPTTVTPPASNEATTISPAGAPARPATQAGPHPTRVVTSAHPRPATLEPSAPTAAPPATPPQGPSSEYAVDRARSRRRTAVWIAIVVVLALLLGFAGWWLGSGRFTDVPTVVGMDRAAATTTLEAAGLVVAVAGRYSDTEPIDTVLGTDPAAGDRIPRRDTIDLLLSLGKPTVPPLPAGGDRSAVEAALRERTLVPGDGGTAYSTTVPEGAVAALDPAPGTPLATGSTVSVVLSRGSPPVAVPDVRGRTVDAARRILDEAGLTVGETRDRFDAGVDGGHVVATDPPSGSEVGGGSTVTLQVSDAVGVPLVMGRSVASARSELEAAGLTVTVRQLADTDTALVIGQVPGAGTRVEPGSAVTLTAVP